MPAEVGSDCRGDCLRRFQRPALPKIRDDIDIHGGISAYRSGPGPLPRCCLFLRNHEERQAAEFRVRPIRLIVRPVRSELQGHARLISGAVELTLNGSVSRLTRNGGAPSRKSIRRRRDRRGDRADRTAAAKTSRASLRERSRSRSSTPPCTGRPSRKVRKPRKRWRSLQADICTSIISPLTIHGQPNLSVTMPKPFAQNVGPKAMVTLPPSAASELKMRSASAAVS